MTCKGIKTEISEFGMDSSVHIPPDQLGNWVDVSPILAAACDVLEEGELIHGDNFNLFAAMSALEIMDPKMDAGVVCRYYSVDEAIENGAAPVPFSTNKITDIQHTIDLMDHLLSCEATWHKGHTLAQTVFSCIYLLQPDRTSPHPLLDSYCRIVRATCNEVMSVVSEARTHEEEPIFTACYGLPLKRDGDEKCCAMLNSVEEAICRQLRICKISSRRKGMQEGMREVKSNSDIEGCYKALLCRLRFRKHFYHAILCMKRSEGRGLESARKHITFCLSELECVVDTARFLQSNNEYGSCENGINEDERTTASGCSPVGFDGSLNSRLSAPIPQRAIQILSWKKAVEYFSKLLNDLSVICLISLDLSLECIFDFVIHFLKSEPDLVARALLQLVLVQDGKLFGKDPIFSVIFKAAGVSDLSRRYDSNKFECIAQLEKLLVDLVKILCSNTAWQRRKLGKILQEWRFVHFQLKASLGDGLGQMTALGSEEYEFGSPYVLIWVEVQTYWIASRFLLLGFELGLYSPCEYCMIYWYLGIVLAKLAEQMYLKKVIINAAAAKKKGKKKRMSQRDVTKEQKAQPEVLFLQCQVLIAEGLALMFASLRNDYNIFHRSGPFNSEHEVFIQRFDHLQRAGIPEVDSFQLFSELTTHGYGSSPRANNRFKEARKISKDLKGRLSNDVEKMEELHRMEQVAEHNNIALNVISSIGTLDPSVTINFEFTYHPFFAVAVVKRT